jgi:hypothetical protein
MSIKSAVGESRGGVSPPRAPKTVRESLDSHGFRCSTADIEEPPVGKEHGFGATNPSQPLSCSLGLTAQALELPSRPADQVGRRFGLMRQLFSQKLSTCLFDNCASHRSSSQLVQQSLGLYQIKRLEAFGEPAVDRS